MKIRVGFVSNSSSSSFVCEVCGRQESGWDACPRDFEMCECVNGHVMCKEDLIEDTEETEEELESSDQENDEEIEDDDEDEDDYESDGYSEIPEKFCPICNFIVFSQSDASSYLEKQTGITRDEAFAEVKKLNKRRKKLYDSEYVMYVCTKQGINADAVLAEVKSKFKTYSEFSEYLND